jgi:hypothetical protein
MVVSPWFSLAIRLLVGSVAGFCLGIGVGELATPTTDTIGDALRFVEIRIWGVFFALLGAAVGTWTFFRARVGA